MSRLVRLIRRMVIRWQLRCLDQQAECIIEARNHALARLMQIRRERGIKEVELWLCDSGETQKVAM